VCASGADGGTALAFVPVVFPPITDEVVLRHDVPGPRYTSYPTANVWGKLTPDTYAARLNEASRLEREPLSLYFHIPFCAERCTFCGCNVVIAKDPRRADEYLEHLRLEMELVAAKLGRRRRFAQLHFGGGTPTFLDEAQLERLWGDISSRFSAAEGAEIAIEIDPAVTSKEQLSLLRSFGFNRISMGVQDFDPAVQRAVNRIQSFESTRDLLEHARALGFSGINFDLIYGLPLQTPASWAKTLDRVLALAPDRAAVYSFAWVPNARPHQRRLAVYDRPAGAAKLELFRMAYDLFLDSGYRAIGMDHFARETDELARAQKRGTLGRNFQGYTVKAASDVVAFGVSAISDVRGAYAQNTPVMAKYYAALRAGRLATEKGIVLAGEDFARRRVISELMCNFGVELGAELRYQRELDELRALEADGLLELIGDRVELTALGRVFVRNVAMVFDEYLRTPIAAPAFSRTV
jgi:oxygen-independent coproporphyrinogen III oxidase